MACKKAKRAEQVVKTEKTAETEVNFAEVSTNNQGERLLFGVDSHTPSNDILQNNLTEFEWAVRNKVYPNFWGRNLTGENALTKEEIDFLHGMGCKIAAIHTDGEPKQTEEQGRILAKKIDVTAYELGIPENTAVFLEIGEENLTRDFMKGFADGLMTEGFTPGFKANTDAAYSFDREFSRGLQTDREIFEKCIVCAEAPSLKEYDRVTTTHLIHPDNWAPFAPSGITRQDIAIWQYGKSCHPIADDKGRETSFNVNLVRDDSVITQKMF